MKQLNSGLNWPKINYNEWKETLNTLHLWTQVVGKIKMNYSPWVNHSWHVALYVGARGLTTGTIPYKNFDFQIDFDFVDHKLKITTTNGNIKSFNLENGMTVIRFYNKLIHELHNIDIEVKINTMPNEIEGAIDFKRDNLHKSYNKEQAYNYWQALVNTEKVFRIFRARFIGKNSPINFFWGAFDLAVSRFSGKKAPKHMGKSPNLPSKVMQESYSHEVCSAGFWPGNEQAPEAYFYSYCYPKPKGYEKEKVLPKEAFYSEDFAEYFLPYSAVVNSENPEETLLQFLQSTYEAAAKTAKWNRDELERDFETTMGRKILY